MGAITYTALREIENDFADFVLPLLDAGSGAVNTTVLRGTGPATFTRATAATTTLSTGLIANVLSGVPRSCYSPAGVYLGYLSEGQRTNLVLQAENFGTTWAAVGTPTRVAGNATCGSVSLDLIGDDDGAGLEGYTQTITFTGNAVKAISVFIKQGTSASTAIRLRDTTAGADRLLAVITWSGAVPVVTMTTGTDLTGTPAQQGTSGVYRLMFATTSVTAANTNSLQVYPATSAALAVANTGNINVGGAQAENAAFPSTYIPTTTATVTRNQDVLSYPVGNILDSLGAAYAEFALRFIDIANPNRIVASDGAAAVLTVTTGGNATAFWDETTETASNGVSSITDGTVHKTASSWNASGARKIVSLDGGIGSAGAYDGTAVGASIRIGSSTSGDLYGAVKNVRIYKSVVSDAILQSMTNLAADFVRMQGQSYSLEFYSEHVTRSVKVNRSAKQPMGGGAPEVLTYRRDTFVDVMVLGPLGALLTEAQMLQWREFLASVEGGETFTFDRYGTIAVPVEPESSILESTDYTEERIAGVGNAGMYKLAFQVRLLT